MTRRFLFALLLPAAIGFAQNYSGPRPPTPDIPYLKHADNLVATETAEAKEEKRKNQTFFVVPGAASPARTPLASPIFLLQADKLVPDKLQLYRMESKNGQREILFSKKDKQVAMPIRLDVTRLASGGLYQIEVEDSLPNGEYSLTPEGSNQVFCFQVY